MILYVLLFLCVCVCVCVFGGSRSACVCAQKGGPARCRLPFGLVSGRVCRNDAAAGSVLLCNPPTSLKHHHSFIIKPCINVGVCTTTTHTQHTCMNARVNSSSSMSCIRIRQSGGTLRNKHFLSEVLGEALVFYLPRGRARRGDTFLCERCVCVCVCVFEDGILPQLCSDPCRALD